MDCVLPPWRQEIWVPVSGLLTPTHIQQPGNSPRHFLISCTSVINQKSSFSLLISKPPFFQNSKVGGWCTCAISIYTPLQTNCDVVRVQNYFILQNLSARYLLRPVESQINCSQNNESLFRSVIIADNILLQLWGEGGNSEEQRGIWRWADKDLQEGREYYRKMGHPYVWTEYFCLLSNEGFNFTFHRGLQQKEMRWGPGNYE